MLLDLILREAGYVEFTLDLIPQKAGLRRVHWLYTRRFNE